jgi:hypothetical protein
LHDGISFEQLGKRAVVPCTEPFEVTARNIARIMGLPTYPPDRRIHIAGTEGMGGGGVPAGAADFVGGLNGEGRRLLSRWDDRL